MASSVIAPGDRLLPDLSPSARGSSSQPHPMTPVFEMMMIILQRIFIESGGQEHPQMLIVAAYPKHHVTCS